MTSSDVIVVVSIVLITYLLASLLWPLVFPELKDDQDHDDEL